MTRRNARDYARSRRLVRSSERAEPITLETLEERRTNWHSDVRMPWPDEIGIEPRVRTSALGEAVRMRYR